MWRCGVLCLAACGRIGFDSASTPADDASTIDTPPGLHDEDGDGIPDIADLCPHMADASNADTDGDLVGDACDPEPANGRQSWVLFNAMLDTTLFGGMPDSCWTTTRDAWQFADAAGPCQLLRVGDLGDVDVWIGVDIDSLGAIERKIAIILNGTSVPYWYGEVSDTGVARVAIIEYDGASFVGRDFMDIGSTFPLGRSEIHLAARVGTSFTIERNGGVAMFATPGFTAQSILNIAFDNLVGKLRYVAIVRTN